MTKYFTMGSASLVLLFAFQNCSKQSFSASNVSPAKAAATGGGDNGGGGTGTGTDTGTGSDPTNVNGGGNTTCHDFNDVTQPLKVAVIVDNSGSTNTTDPEKTFRESSISGFLAAYGDKSNFSWNLMYFQGSSAFDLITRNNLPAFGTITDMNQALLLYDQANAGDDTPYKAALRMASKLIQSDPGYLADPADTNFAILFMSDGIPTDYGTPPDDSAIINDVQTLVNLSPGHISFSTIYFNALTVDEAMQLSPQTRQKVWDPADAIPRLQQMALAGGGQFVNTLVTGSNIDLGSVITVPTSVCTP